MALQLLPRPYRPLSRHSHLAWADKEKLYLWGGCVEGQLPGSASVMHSGQKKVEVVSALETLDFKSGTWKQEKIHGDKSNSPLGIRDCALALLRSTADCNRVRPFIFGGYCGHNTCVHNSLHELCYCTEKEIYEWKEIVPNGAGGCPLKKRNAAAVAFTANDVEQVCVFAGRGPGNSATHQSPPTEYNPDVQTELCWTNELHFLDIKNKGWCTDTKKMTGEPPPPCWDCSFIKVSEDPPKAVVFGGEAPNQPNSTQQFKNVNDVYMLDLEKKEWSTTRPPTSDPWPVLRTRHASCLIASPLTGHKNITLLTVGGADIKDETLKDMHLMDLTNQTTAVLDMQSEIAHRQFHSITAVPVDDSSVQVIIVGGVQNRTANDPTTWLKIQDDFVLGLSWNQSQKKWEWMRSETSLLSEIEHAQLRRELDKITQQLEGVKKELAELKQIVSRLHPPSGNDLHLPLDTAELHIKICQAIAREPNVLSPLADELARVELIVSATQRAIHFSDGKDPYNKAVTMVTPALQNAHEGPEQVRKLMDCFRNVGLQTAVEEIIKFCQQSSRCDSQGYSSSGARQTKRTSTASQTSFEQSASKILRRQGYQH